MAIQDPQHQKRQQLIYQEYQFDPHNIPRHVAIIMDGNGRWAKQRFAPRNIGHKEGAEALRRTIKACVEIGIEYLSVYVFSTENWKRPKKEVSFLMSFFKRLIMREIKELNQEGVRIRCLGSRDQLDEELLEKINLAETQTAQNSVLNLNLLINYGSRREILDACMQLVKDRPEEITEKLFSSYLYTAEMPDPEILIRTGGDFRVSNYLLWQLAYCELFFIDSLWPDFGREPLFSIVKQYQTRERRFGGLG